MITAVIQMITKVKLTISIVIPTIKFVYETKANSVFFYKYIELFFNGFLLLVI